MSSPQQPLRQYSRDGRFWWDGRQWQPVEPAAPPGVPHRRPTRTSAWLVLAGAALLGLLVGGGTGAVGASVAGADPEGPSAPPGFTESFPNPSERYLPGVTVPFISEDWLVKGNKWTCGPSDRTSRPESGAKNRMDCVGPGDAKYDIEVGIEYDDETHVRMVQATCRYGPGSNACKSLFANAADAVLAKDLRLRKQAQDWAGKNADSDNATVIGEVQLLVSLDPHGLYCVPAT